MNSLDKNDLLSIIVYMNDKRINQRKEDDLLSSREAAALLPGTSPAALNRWAREGKVPSHQLLTGRRFYRPEDVLRLLEPQGGAENDAGSEGWSDRPLPGLENA